MQLPHLGQTRSARRSDHLLQTPDTFVRTGLPGLERGTAIVHCGPALGAGFTQYTAELEEGGTLLPSSVQRFGYVLEGLCVLGDRKLHAGSTFFQPEGSQHALVTTSVSRVAIMEKRYRTLPGCSPPQPFISSECKAVPQPLNGDDGLLVRSLVPVDPAYDFAVNTMTYAPGASLHMVEVHVMEHGLLMLEGGGVYRLGDCWYPIAAGDFIWMAPHCPQWFGALGKVPAKYLIYKDWNRHAV